MSEDNKVACPVAQEVTKPAVKFHKKRDIFRFKGAEDLAIDLGHIYKIVLKERQVSFYPAVIVGPMAKVDFVEFETLEAAQRAYESIVGIWSSDVVE